MFNQGEIVHVKHLGLWSNGRYISFHEQSNKHQVKVGNDMLFVNVYDLSKIYNDKKKKKVDTFKKEDSDDI